MDEVEVLVVGLEVTPKVRVGIAMAVAWWKRKMERRKGINGRRAERGILWGWRVKG